MRKTMPPGVARAALAFTFVLTLLGCAAPHAYSQSSRPSTVEADVPFEQRVPWFNRDHTAVEDEVTMRGTLHIVNKVWQSSPTQVDRITIHVNAVDIHGTSETTGQRFRINGSAFTDLRDPSVTFNADGSINLPPAQYKFFFHKVDPEPARMAAFLSGGNGTSVPATYVTPDNPPPPPKRCERVYLPDGTPTGWVDCGNFRWSTWVKPIVYYDRVFVGSGAACPLSGVCQVPDGATLFNGYAGDYNPPLLMRGLSWREPGTQNVRIQWHCKTGDLEAPIFFEGGFAKCSPLYLPGTPITVYTDVSYSAYMYLEEGGYALQNFIVPTAPHVYHYLERQVDHAPVIEDFSVMAHRGPSTCAAGHPCPAPDGAVLFNGIEGDYYPPLYLSLRASDPDGDPIVSVQWYCKTGDQDAEVTDLGGGIFSCNPIYSSVDPIKVYAVVSDGVHEATSEVRTYLMLQRIR